MTPREQLEREIERLEGRLDGTSDRRAIDELATVRRGLASDAPRADGGLELTNVRIGFACKQRWEDMVGDDRVRACGGCDRPVFNLSEMTRAEAEAVLATRGLTPCVRFYRRPDGTVMTTDCPTSARRGGRRLAIVAAGATLAVAPAAMADPPADTTTSQVVEPTDDSSTEPTADVPVEEPGISIDREILMGIPVQRSFDYEMGVMIMDPAERPAVEWSVWGRLGVGVASQQQPDAVARRVTTTPPESRSSSTMEAALAADLTLGVASHQNLRLGIWGEVRTSSDAVLGGEIVLEGLRPHPYTSRIGGAGSLVLRAGANGRIVTGALGFGYVGSFPSYDPWIKWARHMVGARVVVSINRTIDDPRDWSATLGLEIEPIGALHALRDLVLGR